MDSKLPPRVCRAWRPIRRVVHFGPRCINRLVSQPLGWSAQGDQAKVANFWGLALRVRPQPSRGVVSEKELVGSSDTEILEELSSQGVTAVRRTNIKREGKLIPTKHIILTFNSTKLPSTIKAGFLSCPVKPYIPNPIRCFNCQRFDHSKTVCRGKLTCSKCSVIGHSANDCTSDPKCRNYSQAHIADSKLCPQFKTEKKIQELRVRKNISYLEAKKLIPEQKSVTYAQTVKTCLPQSTQTVDYTTKIHCHTCCCQSVAPNQSHSTPSSSTTLNEQPSTSKVPSPVKSKTPSKSKNTDNSKQMKKAGKWETVKESKAAKSQNFGR
ncbi:hypothetical protein AVEN_55949-1 [Araneus ventricosus]|uniref:CCHC-type domain-containing protein n=1 Tax=Araneus ventricosus TaxID=182803 RepID=A0A4Y2X8R4_ARAVE|nr:hypothetical protein AVEN_55949-1 [Araneus ventricosus]